MSAILISEVSASALAALDERERGYDRLIVQKASIQPFGDAGFDVDGRAVFIYVAKSHKLNPELEPNVDYLKLCLNAAGEWGELFRETFLKTTFVSGAPLAEYKSLPR